MNRVQFFALSAFILIGSFTQLVHADPFKVPAYFQTMYIPGGFDSNDLVQIVGEGTFSNSCYRQAETKVRIDAAHQKIYLGATAYYYPGICLMVILPYQKTVNIGILKPGKWAILQEANKGTVGEINIHPATTENADDYLYAPISQAFFFQIKTLGQVMLTGTFSNSCMHLEQVKITVEPNVIAVQPIASMEKRADCQDGIFPFTQNTGISNVPAGRYLLHVRSLNGNAINSLIDVK